MSPRVPLTLTRHLISTTRPVLSTIRTRLTRQQPYSSQQPTKPKSATGEFYKTFTRPVAKTILIAILTYQLIYYAWLKLEQDEVKGEKNGMPRWINLATEPMGTDCDVGIQPR
jgi:hypothetical protein